MSITFLIPKAPTHEVPCEWCEKYGHENPEWGNKCDPHCSGKRTCFVEAPEVNMSNGNGIALLSLILKGEVASDELYMGSWEIEELPKIAKRILWLLNTYSDANSICYDSFSESNGGATIHWQGRTMDYVDRRLEQLQEIVQYAAKNNYCVAWG